MVTIFSVFMMMRLVFLIILDILIFILIALYLFSPFLPLHLSLFKSPGNLLGRVEDSMGLSGTHCTPGRLLIMIQGASFTKVMLTFGNDRISEGLTTEKTLERNHVPVGNLVFRCLSVISIILPLSVVQFNLPATLVVSSIVKEDA